MSAGNLNIALILKLVDQVSGPARAATGALRRIGDTTDRIGRASVDWANQQVAASQARRAALQGDTIGLLALGGGLMALTEPAIQAERRLAEVSKVVDFKSPEGLSILQSEIRDLVTSGGLAATAQGVTDIVAAAGRMGVVDANLPDAQKRKELLEFATAAAKMSAAFGISAEDAGTTLARWRQNLSLSQDQAMLLGDTVNLLGNTMATNEADILQVINRQGVVAQSAGLAANEIAALSATLLAAGAAPEIAATGLKNFTNALTKGASVTKRQAAVYSALGLDPESMSKQMQVSAPAAIMTVLEALQKVPDHMRSSMVGDLFGEEAKGAIMPLVANAAMLEQAFKKTSDTAKLLGLMEDEYQRQAATTFAQRQRFLEFLKGLSVVVGAAVLPQLNELMATLMPILKATTDWAAAHPELVSGLIKLAAGLFAFRLASIALRWTLLATLMPFARLILGGHKLLRLLPLVAMAMGALKPLAWARLIPLLAWGAFIKPIRWLALAGMLGWGKLVRPIKWSSRYIAAIPWRRLAKMLSWRNLVRPIVWSSRYIPAIRWGALGLGALGMTAGGWGKLVKPLIWGAKIGGRALLGPIGWALLAGELVWSLLLSKLPWKDWIDKVDWSYWFSFSWAKELPKWIWEEIIPELNLSSLIFGKGAPSGLSDNPEEVQAAIRRGNALSYGQTSTPIAGARDRGGPVRAGHGYLVGERSPEIFVPDVAGSILPGRVLRAAMAATALAGSATAMPSKIEITQRVDQRPALQSAAPAPQITRHGDSFHFHIAAQPGADPEAIAKAVRREFETMNANRRGDLDDGVDY